MQTFTNSAKQAIKGVLECPHLQYQGGEGFVWKAGAVQFLRYADGVE
ncbi:hypothetical protein [Aureliella helgolandensis]|uniref:Uncharacterized protein n=1 Tax=Aureliella helgolandensis TaxID=2527968 RepID=A0A518G512_9BACT|nr:hypothetical protein [Aureliella helgolandensis]QDV23629.1 hypothetical protein Q31a_19320 [Aureliella helgolandensis]